jgi:phosphoglycolate phosphatase
MQKSKYRLIIFDFDGTLADSFPWFITIYDDLAQRFNLPNFDKAQLQQFRQVDMVRLFKDKKIPFCKVVRIGNYLKKKMSAEIENIRLAEGMQTVIDKLVSLRIKLAIVSSNKEENVRKVLGEQYAPLFEHYECGVSIYGKASKFKKILKASGVSSEQALSIGDEVRDLKSSHKVGIAFGAATWGYTDLETLSANNPDKLFTEPLQILDIIEISPN